MFACVAENKISRGDTLLEFLESTYVAFHDKQVSMRRAITCICLEPLPNSGTRLHDVMQMSLPVPKFLHRIRVPAFLKLGFKYDQALQKAAQLSEEEYSKSKSA